MKYLFVISLSAFAALALFADAASIRNETDELTRTKRTLGVDRNVKKEYEIKTKYGTTIKVSKSVAYNDGGGLTMAPALIDSIGANRRKLIYALRGYKYCNNGCVSNASSDENESPGDDNIVGMAEEPLPAQAGGEIGGLGGASAGAAAEAWGEAQTTGGSEGSAVASSQASAQASSGSEGSAVSSSQVSAQASSQAEGSASASSQAAAQASSQVQAGGSGQAAAQGVAEAPGQIVISEGCGAYGCEGIVGGAGNPVVVPQVVQGEGWGVGSQVVGSGSGWEGTEIVGGWPGGCTGAYTECMCSQMLPVLMSPANSYGHFRSHHPRRTSPFSRVIKRHIRSKIRPLLSNRYPTNTLCSQYNPCCTPYRK